MHKGACCPTVLPMRVSVFEKDPGVIPYPGYKPLMFTFNYGSIYGSTSVSYNISEVVTLYHDGKMITMPISGKRNFKKDLIKNIGRLL